MFKKMSDDSSEEFDFEDVSVCKPADKTRKHDETGNQILTCDQMAVCLNCWERRGSRKLYIWDPIGGFHGESII